MEPMVVPSFPIRRCLWSPIAGRRDVRSQDVIEAALAGGCRWISLREKDLPADEQILRHAAAADGASVWRRPDAAWRWRARQAFRRRRRAPAGGSNAAAGRADIGAEKLLGVSIHTAREARAIDPALSTMRSPGPHSRRRASPVTARGSAAGSWPRSRLPQRVPVLAIGGIDRARRRPRRRRRRRCRGHGRRHARGRPGAGGEGATSRRWPARSLGALAETRARYVLTP